LPERRTHSLGAHVVANALPVLFILGWWLSSRGLPSFVLPSPLATARALVMLFVDPAFLGDTLASLLRVVVSVILAVIFGGALAALARYVPASAHAVYRRIMPVLNSFPSIGWAILATFWFQPSNGSIIFVETLILIPFCAIAMGQGLNDMDRDLIEMGNSFSRSRRRVAWRIGVPLLLPYVISSVRIAYGVGWKIALVAELFGVTSGLGYLMLKAEVSSDTAMVFATCFAIVIIFIVGEKFVIDPVARRSVFH
jgi:NitT/TauT family transport system permease protein/sulfonate transport system permease protein